MDRKIKLSVGPGIEVEKIELGDDARPFRRVLLANDPARSVARLRRDGSSAPSSFRMRPEGQAAVIPEGLEFGRRLAGP
jgi:hypothetical protein